MPIASAPRFTVSIAYSTWYSRPSGEKTVIARSYPCCDGIIVIKNNSNG